MLANKGPVHINIVYILSLNRAIIVGIRLTDSEIIINKILLLSLLIVFYFISFYIILLVFMLLISLNSSMLLLLLMLIDSSISLLTILSLDILFSVSAVRKWY